MKFKSIFILLFINIILLSGQTIPFNQEKWDIQGQGYILEAHEGYESIYLKNGVAKLKEVSFQNGIVEFDVFMNERRSFSGMLFRMQDDENYEEIYLRGHLNGMPDAMQYTPVNNGSASWQLYHDQGRPVFDGKIGWRVESVGGYNALFRFPNNRWFHVKLVISGNRADLYLDQQENPALQIRNLKRTPMAGGVAVRSFRGGVHFANFSYKEMETISLSDLPKLEKRPAIQGLITQWQVSNPFAENALKDQLILSDNFVKKQQWQNVQTEATGLVNINVLHQNNRESNTVFTKVNIESTSDQLKELGFGYSDRVKVYCNGQLIYSGNNGYRTRDYRYLGTIGFFDSVYLPLKKGDNELLLAVSETFGGWGVQAKMSDRDGITVE